MDVNSIIFAGGCRVQALTSVLVFGFMLTGEIFTGNTLSAALYLYQELSFISHHHLI